MVRMAILFRGSYTKYNRKNDAPTETPQKVRTQY
jgi:hypothetical protein